MGWHIISFICVLFYNLHILAVAQVNLFPVSPGEIKCTQPTAENRLLQSTLIKTALVTKIQKWHLCWLKQIKKRFLRTCCNCAVSDRDRHIALLTASRNHDHKWRKSTAILWNWKEHNLVFYQQCQRMMSHMMNTTDLREPAGVMVRSQKKQQPNPLFEMGTNWSPHTLNGSLYLTIILHGGTFCLLVFWTHIVRGSRWPGYYLLDVHLIACNYYSGRCDEGVKGTVRVWGIPILGEWGKLKKAARVLSNEDETGK